MRISAWLMVALLLWVPALQAATLEQQRGWFKQAKKALKNQHMKQFHSLKAKLKDYPLTPYLDIWQARRALAQGHDLLAAETLALHADVPESIDLRKAWVGSLARRGQWPHVHSMMSRYPSLASRLPETTMVAHWRMGNKAISMQTFSERWQRAATISRFSEGLHQAWLKQGHPTKSERWNRIVRLAEQRKWTAVRALSASFSQQQKQWLSYWRSVQNKPHAALQKWPGQMAAMPADMIIGDGIKRLSRIDVSLAWQRLQQIKAQAKHVSLTVFADLERYVALRAARQHVPEAAGWLADLPASHHNEDTRGWQARLHMLADEHHKTLTVIASMPFEEQQQSRWLYWQAKSLVAIGKPVQARALYAELAQQRGYYSFLSAEQLGQPLHLEAVGIVASDAEVSVVAALAGVQRAFEWRQLGKISKAAREWHFTLAGSDVEQWQAAAVLATRWGWHDQVIRAAFKGDALDALLARFPMSYAPSVAKSSRETGLTDSEIWSIIRQESAFNPHAASYAGAKGLMQLMPATAKQVARQLKLAKGARQLFSPAINIRLGSTYLAEQKERFGSLALAAAAYNAGPHRVSQWLARTPFDAAEAWVEAIPFNETRRYVQQVMAFVTVYEWRQSRVPTSLIARLNGVVQGNSAVQKNGAAQKSGAVQKVSLNEDILFDRRVEGGNH